MFLREAVFHNEKKKKIKQWKPTSLILERSSQESIIP